MTIAQFLQTTIILCSSVTHHCPRLLLIMQPLVSHFLFYLRDNIYDSWFNMVDICYLVSLPLVVVLTHTSEMFENSFSKLKYGL